MEIGKEMDAGDIVAQKKIDIENDDNTETLSWKLVNEGVPLLMNSIDDYVTGKIKLIPQSKIKVEPSYANKLNPEEKLIDWSMDAAHIHNLTRALYPWPVAESKINDLTIKFIKTKVIPDVGDTSDLEIGAVVEVDKKNGFFTIKTGQDLLLVEKVKPSGKKELDVSSFLNGYALKRGMRFNNV